MEAAENFDINALTQIFGPAGKDIVLSDVPDTRDINCFGIQIYGDSVWVLGDDGLRRWHARHWGGL